MKSADMLKKLFVPACFFLLNLLASEPIHAQLPADPPDVFIMTGEIKTPMRAVTSQTEQKKGWDIQGIRINGKIIRYFWGKQSKQLCGRKPVFAIYPRQGTLNDYAIIRLNKRREYRRLPYPQPKECSYTRINIESFCIQNLPDMGFLATPLDELFPGEYILINLEQTPCNEAGDIKAYDFTVEE